MQGLGRYSDDNYEYRHVQLPKQMLKAIPKEYFDGARGTLKLLWEEEWRGLGITQVSAYNRCRIRVVVLTSMVESGLGALRSTRAGATHSPVQASKQLPASYAPMIDDRQSGTCCARRQESAGAVQTILHNRVGRKATRS